MTTMKQRLAISVNEPRLPFVVSVFETRLGWFSLIGDSESSFFASKIGSADSPSAIKACRSFADDCLASAAIESMDFEFDDWNPELRQRLVEFTEGEPADFSDLVISYAQPLTQFQTKVIQATRTIGFGETKSYGQVAQLAGSPRAARAVGSTMRANNFPIVVPCHRVIAAGGKIGGFTSPRGVSMKRQLLTMEAEGLESLE